MTQHLPMDADTQLATQGKRLALIRQYANEADPAAFDGKWLAVLRSCATWFSSMPLQPEQHAEPGGAFRATVEVVYFAMRLSGDRSSRPTSPLSAAAASNPSTCTHSFWPRAVPGSMNPAGTSTSCARIPASSGCPPRTARFIRGLRATPTA
ncbi:hypothetical protein [Cupriavidus sp. D39]|uniref:hypothetical protein n=1 Tax=Cupriavidus sp. D39 TaxID=2997877 RepID=UPI002D1E3527|nr:hypothetical protein [Cupriavidus sp. D39]